MTQAEKQAIMAEYAVHEGDTGSSGSSDRSLTKRIKDLTEHLKEHTNDHHSRRKFLKWSVAEEISLAIFKRLTSRDIVQLSPVSFASNKNRRANKRFFTVLIVSIYPLPTA